MNRYDTLLSLPKKKQWSLQGEISHRYATFSGFGCWFRNQGHDTVHASQIDLNRASDDLIIQYARSEDRIIITADLDYPRLLARISHRVL